MSDKPLRVGLRCKHKSILYTRNFLQQSFLQEKKSYIKKSPTEKIRFFLGGFQCSGYQYKDQKQFSSFCVNGKNYLMFLKMLNGYKSTAPEFHSKCKR